MPSNQVAFVVKFAIGEEFTEQAQEALADAAESTGFPVISVQPWSRDTISAIQQLAQIPTPDGTQQPT